MIINNANWDCLTGRVGSDRIGSNKVRTVTRSGIEKENRTLEEDRATVRNGNTTIATYQSPSVILSLRKYKE
jgi:hypothetical protein